MLPARLDYLFTARFKDGSVIHQTRHDVSQVEPLTRSAFWDVLQRLPELASFTLASATQAHTVFLADGRFNSDGRIITSPHGELTNFRLIYFRRVQQSVSGDFKHRPEVMFYFLGWQANDARGKNFQMIIRLSPPGTGPSQIHTP